MAHTHIPESVVLYIKQKADILEVVGHHVELKKKGANYWACCPFHNESTPSFSVSPNKNLYKCFGCGKSGDSISFLMEYLNISYADCLVNLAEFFNIEIPKEERKENENQKLYDILKVSASYFSDNLGKNQTASTYLAYRNLSPESIKNFSLGYSLENWEDLKNFLKNEDLAEKAGLLAQKNDHTFDRFRGRIMFPIPDVSGRIIGFGARAMHESEQPKYLNSPESEVYHKSEVLYGLFQAKNEIRKKDECILVEGYFDVIRLHQIGFKNTVASSGTSLTVQQVKLIKRFSENITVLYDGDTAGQNATMKAIDICLAQNMNVKIVRLPLDKDPDSFFKLQNLEFAKKFLEENAMDFVDYKMSVLPSETVSEKNKAIKDILATTDLIEDSVLKGLFWKKINEKFDLQILPKKEPIQEVPNVGKKIALKNDFLEKNILELEAHAAKILIHQGAMPVGSLLVYEYFISELSDVGFLTPNFREFLFLFKKLHLDNALETGVLEQLCPEYFKHLISEKSTIMSLEKLYRFVLRIKFIFLKISLKEILKKMSESPNNIEECFFVQMNLQKQIQEISKILGISITNLI